METKIRSDIPLEMTIKIGLYCTSGRPLESVNLSIDDYSKRLVISCFDSSNLVSSKFNGFETLSNIVKKEFINEFEYVFPLDANKDKAEIIVKEVNDIVLLDYATVQFSVKYTGFRKFMLRWRKTCHVIGTFFFSTLISSCFILSFVLVFSYVVNS